MKKTITLLLSLIPFFSFPQVVPIAWVQNYNGPADNDDQATSLVIDASGNAYVTGTSFATNGSYDIVTVKYNNNGVQQWAASYNGPGNNNDGANAIAIDASGNVYITGRAKSISNLEDIVTIKYNSAGIQQWVVTYNGSGNGIDEGKDIAVDAAGNVYVTGFITNPSVYTDMMTLKYNSAGTLQWATPFNGTGNGNDEGRGVVLDGSGNIYICGKGNETTSGTLSDIVTIKYNNSGVQQWMAAYDGGNDNDYGKAIARDAAGNIVVTGQSFFPGNWFDYATIKYDAAGTQQWAMRYNLASNKYEDPTDITTDINNNVYVTGMGQAAGPSTAQNDIVTIKYNAAGSQQWMSRYTSAGNNDDRGYGVAIDDTLNVYVTGYVTISPSDKDYMTIKYDAAGTQKWTAAYNGAGSGIDQASAIAVSSSAEVYVTGYTDGTAGPGVNNDYTTIKYATMNIGFAEYGGTLSQIILYPNPAAGGSTISITSEHLDADSKLFLSVYDVAGREMISQREFKSNNKFATFNIGADELPKGIYLVRVNDNKKKISGVGRLMVQ